MKATMKIEGMSCENCVKHVTNALRSVTGVRKAQVSLKDNQAIVEYEAPATPEQLRAAVEEEEYDVIEIQEG